MPDSSPPTFFTGKVDASVLQEAQGLIHGQRQKTYGSPSVNFKAIADLWSTYLNHDVSVDDVCIMMALLKLARLKTGGAYHRDSVVDACGYLAILELVQSREQVQPVRPDRIERRYERKIVSEDFINSMDISTETASAIRARNTAIRDHDPA